MRIERTAFVDVYPIRLKERFAEEQLRGHTTEGPQIQVRPVAHVGAAVLRRTKWPEVREHDLEFVRTDTASHEFRHQVVSR